MVQAASASRGRIITAVVISAVLLVALALAVGRFTAPVHIDPGTHSAEAGFARDMQVHHQQAVQLAMLVRDRTDDPDLRLLAYDIATAQSQQSGQLYGWLAQWGVAQAPPEPPMTWMSRPTLSDAASGHDHSADPAHAPGGAMPGMATPAEVAELTAADGPDAERIFLRLMIAHHEGGVEMADALLERSVDPIVTTFARGVVTSQTAEIATMTSMLAALDG